MRLLCLTVVPDGGVMTPVLTRMGFSPYTFRTVFQGSNIRHHPAEWEALLLGRKTLQSISFLKHYDCVIGAPGTILYERILPFCPPYTKVILITVRDKVGWATTYEQFMTEFQKKQSSSSRSRLSHVGRAQKEFYSLVESMTVGLNVEVEKDQDTGSKDGRRTENANLTSISRSLSSTSSRGLSSSVIHRVRALEKFEQKVQRTVHPNRLLVYHPSQGVEPLCKFLGVEMVPSLLTLVANCSVSGSSDPSLSIPREEDRKADPTTAAYDRYGLNIFSVLEDRFDRVALLYRVVKWGIIFGVVFLLQSYVVKVWDFLYQAYREFQEAYVNDPPALCTIDEKK